jgi:alanine-glyoxylate transaminase/serine-glyoxylate transaminase/serine-pyruvate transaminase
MSRPTLGHLDPEFLRMMDELKEHLRYAFRTSNEATLAVSGPGSVGMECCFVNLVEPGDKVIVARNGVFGGRMIENVERCGGSPIVVEAEWGRPVDPARVEEALDANPDAKIVALVHAETSTGARSDVEAIAAAARSRDCLTIVDAVTSLGGIPVEVDAWGLDAVYSGSQKCLSCTPGLSPVTFSDRAVEAIRGRSSKVRSWFLDMNLVFAYWGSGEGKRAYHHTAPIHALYGLHEALTILREEGLERAWARHALHHRALRAGVEAMGLRFVVDEEWRLPQLNAVRIPEGVEDAAVRARLLADHGIEIGAGLGALAGKVWRVGLMGHSSRRRNVLLFLGALDEILRGAGASVEHGVAVEAATSVYSRS